MYHGRFVFFYDKIIRMEMHQLSKHPIVYSYSQNFLKEHLCVSYTYAKIKLHLVCEREYMYL